MTQFDKSIQWVTNSALLALLACTWVTTRYPNLIWFGVFGALALAVVTGYLCFKVLPNRHYAAQGHADQASTDLITTPAWHIYVEDALRHRETKLPPIAVGLGDDHIKAMRVPILYVQEHGFKISDKMDRASFDQISLYRRMMEANIRFAIGDIDINVSPDRVFYSAHSPRRKAVRPANVRQFEEMSTQ
jgi:hypothetical protein